MIVVFETPHFFNFPALNHDECGGTGKRMHATHRLKEHIPTFLICYLTARPGETDCLSKELEKEEEEARESTSGQYICQLSCKERHITGNLCYVFFNTTRVVSYFTRTFKNNLKVNVTQDDSQR